MPRYLIFLSILLFSISAYCKSKNIDIQIPKNFEIIYPHNARRVAIIFSSNDSQLEINYLTTENSQKKMLSKKLSQEDTKIIQKDWDLLKLSLTKSPSEFNCESSIMWVVEVSPSEKKAICRNEKIIKELATIHHKIQMLMF